MKFTRRRRRPRVNQPATDAGASPVRVYRLTPLELQERVEADALAVANPIEWRRRRIGVGRNGRPPP